MMNGFDTLVVSDIHLGARNSRRLDFLRFLRQVSFERLIVAGDLFDSRRFYRLREQDYRVLDALRALAEYRKVDWLRGNHDPLPEAFAAMLGVPLQEEVTLRAGYRCYLVCHGDRWDRSLEAPGAIVAGADALYYVTQCIDPSHRLARGLKRLSKIFCNVSDAIQRGGVSEALGRGMDGVILGHSHAVRDLLTEEGIHYLNSGCWTEQPASFVGVRGRDVRTYLWEADEYYPLRQSELSPASSLSVKAAEFAHA